MAPDDAFLLFFKGLARNAPGTDEATLRALEACEVPDDPVVYDLGCGTGSSALVLAEELQTMVVAVDQLAASLDELRTRAQRRGIDQWIETEQADYLELEVEPGSVDLIWSEGAIYAAGWDNALKAWRELLAPGGYLVISDAVWASDARPSPAAQFWEREYPEMSTATALETLAEEFDLDVVASFPLEDRGWEDYYGPLGQRVALVLQSDTADADMREVAEAVQEEISIRDQHGEAVDYRFFILRRPSD